MDSFSDNRSPDRTAAHSTRTFHETHMLPSASNCTRRFEIEISPSTTASSSRRSFNLDHPQERDHRLHRSIGLRKVDGDTVLRPDERSHRRGDREWPNRTRGPVMARTSMVELRRRIGMVFQKPNPFPKTSTTTSPTGPRLHGRGSSDTRRDRRAILRAQAAWDEVKDRLDASAMGLSGGQQQRLCIARALAVAARGDPDGRALFGARSDRDGEHRGTDARDQARITRSSSSPITCSRPPERATARPSSPPRSIPTATVGPAAWSSSTRR